MEAWDLLRNIWYVLIGVLFLGYSLLDGFDLGIGCLLPFFGKKEEYKAALIESIGPFWDGNEVWLLTAGGALFAAFPQAYATVFSGFYLALMVVLFSLIFRAVALEFRTHDPKRKRFWEGAFITGSFLPALLYGVALGNVIAGVPLNGRMDYTGSFFTLLRPFPLVMGLTGLAAFLLQGSTFAALKTEEALAARARRAAGLILVPYIILIILSLILAQISLPGTVRSLSAWIFSALLLLSLFRLKSALVKRKDGWAFFLSSLNFAALWGIVGSIHFPNLVRASNDPSLSITVSNASSSELTLKVMLIIALIGMPLVIGYTIYLYRIFKGRIKKAY